MKRTGRISARSPIICVCAPTVIQGHEPLKRRLARVGVVGRSTTDLGDRSIWVGRTIAKRITWSRMSVPCRFHAIEHVVSHRLAVEGFAAALLSGQPFHRIWPKSDLSALATGMYSAMLRSQLCSETGTQPPPPAQGLRTFLMLPATLSKA